jgi:hypothetical protein
MIIEALARAMTARDGFTYLHAQRGLARVI